MAMLTTNPEPETTGLITDALFAMSRELVTPASRRLSVLIGPEGGFDPEEIDAIRRLGGAAATLGPRILRCETAPLAALTLLMHLSGNME